MLPMIRDVAYLLRHMIEILRLVRGVVAALLAALAVGALVLMVSEGLSLGEALYLTAVTALTVGYGDLAPTTAIGRLVCVIIGLVGVVMVGIIVAVANRTLAQAVLARQREENARPVDEEDA